MAGKLNCYNSQTIPLVVCWAYITGFETVSEMTISLNMNAT